MSNHKEIIDALPYGPGFCFVDQLVEVNENGITGYYTFPEKASYYDSHFPDHPVTPGVLLSECMAQIGLVCLGIFLAKAEGQKEAKPFVFTESQVHYLKQVLPGEQVQVVSEKVYYRLGKLKCKVNMYNSEKERICYGTMAGMILKQ
ncbi:MAG TPA: FabA/FabZ family ACP-dehydratase [Saprospiraceae bacterium]|nr:FabA/FabZ family ACP-dehydratase [Saprospiraceae bacterium]